MQGCRRSVDTGGKDKHSRSQPPTQNSAQSFWWQPWFQSLWSFSDYRASIIGISTGPQWTHMYVSMSVAAKYATKSKCLSMPGKRSRLPWRHHHGHGKASPCRLLIIVLDRRFGSGSGSEPNGCHTGGPGCQSTWTINSGTVWWETSNASEFGEMLVGCSAGRFVDSYTASVFAAW